jgi:hypothetical protein
VIAGVVTCLRQANPYATVQEICDAIRACGDRANNPDRYYGYGIPDFAQALELLNVEDSVSGKELISVYPNPSNGEVHVALNDAHKVELTVYDIMGRKVLTTNLNNTDNTIDISSLPQGLYLIKTETYTKKFYKF